MLNMNTKEKKHTIIFVQANKINRINDQLIHRTYHTWHNPNLTSFWAKLKKIHIYMFIYNTYKVSIMMLP